LPPPPLPTMDGVDDMMCSSNSASSDEGDDQMMGGIGAARMEMQAGAPMDVEAEEEEEAEEAEEGEEDEAGGAGENDFVDELLAEAEDELDCLNRQSQRREAWTHIRKLLDAVVMMCDFRGGYATGKGGTLCLFLAEEPVRTGDEDEVDPNLAAFVLACGDTTRPRYRCLARAFHKSCKRNAPGSVVSQDIVDLQSCYNARAPAKYKIADSKSTQAKYAKLARGLDKWLAEFSIPYVMVTVIRTQSKCFCWGYSKTYPLINLVVAAATTGNVQSIPMSLEERRRATPGHGREDFDELQVLIEELYPPV
jgi:hypothetical protein